jgi:hypothetical protein
MPPHTLPKFPKTFNIGFPSRESGITFWSILALVGHQVKVNREILEFDYPGSRSGHSEVSA